MSQLLKKIYTEEDFESDMNKYDLDDEYSDYLMNHTDARVGNGHQLIVAMERGDYYESFKDYTIGARNE